MADKDPNAASRAEFRKKLATFSLAQRELIGKAVINGLIHPDIIVASTGGGGNYMQDGGPYSQSGGGNHIQGGNGGYNQSKALAFDAAELLARLLNEQLKTRG